ncbi:MAG: signal peptidase II [Candidatus Omnitrophota bacterium]|nr:signal peptidase II [Candidatus Omnitrophota bacterium]
MTCLVLIASLVIIIDRLAKFLVFNNMLEGQSVEILPKIFHITLVLNTGAAFGLFKDKNQFFIVMSFIVVALIFAYVWLGKRKDLVSLSALGLILGGAAGNVIDRLIFGHIIDFLDFRVWPVFNVADSSITIGAVLLVLRLFSGKKCCTQ